MNSSRRLQIVAKRAHQPEIVLPGAPKARQFPAAHSLIRLTISQLPTMPWQADMEGVF
jgi:hypothetical protein